MGFSPTMDVCKFTSSLKYVKLDLSTEPGYWVTDLKPYGSLSFNVSATPQKSQN